MKNLTIGLSIVFALSTAQAATSVKIATMSPLSGAASNQGIQLKNGAQLAVNEMIAPPPDSIVAIKDLAATYQKSFGAPLQGNEANAAKKVPPREQVEASVHAESVSLVRE